MKCIFFDRQSGFTANKLPCNILNYFLKIDKIGHCLPKIGFKMGQQKALLPKLLRQKSIKKAGQKLLQERLMGVQK